VQRGGGDQFLLGGGGPLSTLSLRGKRERDDAKLIFFLRILGVKGWGERTLSLEGLSFTIPGGRGEGREKGKILLAWGEGGNLITNPRGMEHHFFHVQR